MPRRGNPLSQTGSKISAYGVYEFGEREALHKVLIGRGGADETLDDISKRSRIVEAIPAETLYRVYVPEVGDLKKIYKLWEEIAR